MMRDLFPELLASNSSGDVEQARALAWALIENWFATLRYSHSEATHAEILDSLSWQGMRDFVADAGLHIQDHAIDFDAFADGIRAQARRAEAAGLVVPAGKPRKRRRAAARDGDLFTAGGAA